MDLNDAKSLATTLIEHHLGASSGWTFKFDRAESSFGICSHHKKLITLSYTLTQINPEAQVTDTILHEIAHAIAGPKAGHGPEWKAVSRQIGARPVRTGNGIGMPKRYIGECPNGHETFKSRRDKTACGRCCRAHNNGKYSAEFAFVWRENPLRTKVAA